MRMTTLGGVIALSLLSVAPLAAQSGPEGWHQRDSSGWNGEAFWRGAPQGTRERIRFLQQRIDRGIADGSLDPREARRSQFELNRIDRTAMRLRQQNGGRMRPEDRDMIQARLDDLSRRLRWLRNGDRYGYTSQPVDDDRRFVTDYDASRYYRDDSRYEERRLSAQDEVYRGSDGRYYCKHNDGTTGLIVGAAGGGLLGNVIDGGHNRVAGTLIGGALGALAGKAIDQNSDVRCR